MVCGCILLFGAKLSKKNEIAERSLRKISYFCIVKRNICLFKSFFAYSFMLLVCIGNISAHEVSVPRDTSVLDSVDISLLTCQPHDEVYSLYGHTSIRVQDYARGRDYAVNFGVFDSTADYFALRFLFGLTDYMMAVCDFERFLEEYRYYGSGVYQQHINMSREEKAVFMEALYEQARPENVVYRYNFVYNNCTTRARDIILGAIDGEVQYVPTSLQCGEKSIRQLIHTKNENNRWARVGNDLVLGFQADANANHSERQFLPEVLMHDFDSALVMLPDGTSKPLVDEAHWVLLPGTPYHSDDVRAIPISPRTMAILFFCAVLTLCLVEMFLLRRTLLWLEYCIVLLYGLAGIVLLLMVFSKHPTVNLNLQILILNPVFLILMFPRLHYRWKWHIVMFCIFLFYVGNVVQTYAEGMNIMASSLLLLALKGLLYNHSKHLIHKK